MATITTTMTSVQTETPTSDPPVLANVSAGDLDACPACGRRVAAVNGVQLPAGYDQNPGGCLAEAVPGEHYSQTVHPDLRPDVLVVMHRENAE